MGYGPDASGARRPAGLAASTRTTLHHRSAGAAIEDDGNQLFRRETDDFVDLTLGKRPLDVGADRIARTALQALRLLGDLRAALREPTPLCWEPYGLKQTEAIEVNPAASLKERGLEPSKYKENDGESRRVRDRILAGLSREFKVSPSANEAGKDSDDTLDAMICALAGLDFLDQRCLPPVDRSKAEREGWIWFRALSIDSRSVR